MLSTERTRGLAQDEICQIDLVSPDSANPSATAFALFVWNFEREDPVPVGVIAILFGSTIPLVLIGLLRTRDMITAYDAPIRQERTAPYLISASVYIVGLAVLYVLGASVFVQALMWCSAANTMLLALGVCPSNHRTTLKWGFIV
jgi:hypothetical protein